MQSAGPLATAEPQVIGSLPFGIALLEIANPSSAWIRAADQAVNKKIDVSSEKICQAQAAAVEQPAYFNAVAHFRHAI
jgi:hypothetical protein